MIHDAYQFGAWSGILALYYIEYPEARARELRRAEQPYGIRPVWSSNGIAAVIAWRS